MESDQLGNPSDARQSKPVTGRGRTGNWLGSEEYEAWQRTYMGEGYPSLMGEYITGNSSKKESDSSFLGLPSI